MHSRAGLSSSGFPGEGPASKLTQVAGRIYFSLVVELMPLQSQQDSRMVLLVTQVYMM